MGCKEEGSRQDKPLEHVCVCGRRFETHRGLKIHHGRKNCYGNAEGNGTDVKSEKTSSSQVRDKNHSNETNCTPNAEPANTTPEVPRICWPKMNDVKSWKSFDEDVGMILMSVSGSLSNRLVTMQNVIHTLASERFSKVKVKKEHKKSVNNISRRQKRIGELKVKKNSLRAQWKACQNVEEEDVLKKQFEEMK